VLLRGGRGFEALMETQAQVRYLGYNSLSEYLADACILASETIGPGNRRLRPAIEVGDLKKEDLAGLGEVIDHIRLDLEPCDAPTTGLAPVSGVQSVVPPEATAFERAQLRLALLQALRLRTVVSIWMGMGETQADIQRLQDLIVQAVNMGLPLAGVALRPVLPWATHSPTWGPMTTDADASALVASWRAVLPASIEVWLQAEGRPDLLEVVRTSDFSGIGFLTINAPLPSGQHVGEWFESNVGPIHLHRYRKAGAVTPPPDSGEPAWHITESGLMHDGKVAWQPLHETGSWPAHQTAAAVRALAEARRHQA